MHSRQQIQDIARSWLDTPFKHQGREKGKKCDCVGLILGVGWELGMPHLEAPRNYAMAPASNLVLQYMDRQLIKQPDTRMIPGNVAVMWGFDRHEAQHLAIIAEHAGRPTFVHAFSRPGKVVEQTVDQFWIRRMVATYEYPDTEPYSGA